MPFEVFFLSYFASEINKLAIIGLRPSVKPNLKKEKDAPLCASYRGITVTPIIGKTFEYSMLRKLKLDNMVFVRKEDINFLLFLRCSALIPYSSLLLFVFSLSIEFCTSSSVKGSVA
jgi:hypothetical protein